MERMATVCFECKSLTGCKEDKTDGKIWRCDDCKQWERCWLDLRPVGSPPPKETSTFCWSCKFKRDEEKRRKKDGENLRST